MLGFMLVATLQRLQLFTMIQIVLSKCSRCIAGKKSPGYGITIQALLSISPISPQVWAEFPEFKTLPEKLVQDINILFEGDTMLMKCLLHACHEYIQKI